MIGGPSVDQGAVQQQQQNQQQAQQYAQQQQKTANDTTAAWQAAHPAPGQSAPPMQMPNASSPQSIGGGNFQAQSARPPGVAQPQMQGGPQPQGITQQPGIAQHISPQLRQMLSAALGAQKGM